MAEDTASAILKDEEALGLREEKKTEDFSAQADALIQRVEQARQASLQGRRSVCMHILKSIYVHIYIYVYECIRRQS